MADYISRQAVIDTVKYDYFTAYTKLEGVNEVKAIPAADVVPVIRCKECKYFMSPHACSHDDGMITAQSNGFCSYGERKE